MKSSYLLTSALTAALLVASCDNASEPLPAAAGEDNSVTFTLRTPAGENVVYGRALHESDEFAINSLALYEYEVAEDGSTSLARIMKKDGNGKNALVLTEDAENSYTFSIIVPAENDGKQYSYKFVANDATSNPAVGSSFDDFAATGARLTLAGGESADVFCAEGTGIAMSGVAKGDDGSEVITMKKGARCTVELTRIVSRIDIEYQTPNLKVTSVELHGAPATGTLFPAATLAVPAEGTSLTLAMNANTPLPGGFLSELSGDKFEMKKAFYIYERANTDDDCVSVHIEYNVAANGLTDYTGSVDVPFRKTDGTGTYIDAVRNHLYTIVLGNGTDPVSGKVSATVKVAEWNGVDIDEPLTDEDDPVINN